MEKLEDQSNLNKVGLEFKEPEENKGEESKVETEEELKKVTTDLRGVDLVEISKKLPNGNESEVLISEEAEDLKKAA